MAEDNTITKRTWAERLGMTLVPRWFLVAEFDPAGDLPGGARSVFMVPVDTPAGISVDARRKSGVRKESGRCRHDD